MLKVSPRAASVMIAASAVLVTAALWSFLVIEAGFSQAQAALMSGLVLLSLAQLHVFVERTREQKLFSTEIERILVSTHDLLGDMKDLRGEFDTLRSRIGEKNYLHADKIAGQLAALEETASGLDEREERARALEEQLANQVGALNQVADRLAERARSVQPVIVQPAPEPRSVPAEKPDEPPAPPTNAAEHNQTESVATFEPDAEPIPAPVDPDLIDTVERALGENRTDVYLQPIVTLPQRKVRYYEALTRLRDEEGGVLLPAEYLPAAEAAGLTALVDQTVLTRSIALVRRLMERRRDVGIFCNISAHSLFDSLFFADFIELMEQNKDLSDALIFEVTEDSFQTMGPLETESLKSLVSLGFRFSLDHVQGMDIDFDALAKAGFRYLKIGASTLLDAANASSAPVHPEDWTKLAERHGITVVVEKIEAENTVVNLLDYDVGLAQGFLFSRPRLVREDGSAVPIRAAA